jgi:cytochrome c biogenesis protein CcdA
MTESRRTLLVTAGLLALAALGGVLLKGRLPILEYYAFLSSLTTRFSEPLNNLVDTVNIPVLGAVLLGLLGATSPCQLTSNVAAVAYAGKQVGRAERVMSSALAFVAGKALVYTLVGGLIILLGLQLNQVSIPVIVAVRKAMGPLLVFIGLSFLGLVKLNPSTLLGAGLSMGAGWRWLEQRAEGRGELGAFLLGVAFAFVF